MFPCVAQYHFAHTISTASVVYFVAKDNLSHKVLMNGNIASGPPALPANMLNRSLRVKQGFREEAWVDYEENWAHVIPPFDLG